MNEVRNVEYATWPRYIIMLDRVTRALIAVGVIALAVRCSP